MKIVSDWKWFVEAIILNDASYRYIDILLSVFDRFGISSTNRDTMFEEKFCILRELINERILLDYKNFIDLDYELYKKELEIRSSLSYRLGNLILQPLTLAKKVYKKIIRKQC